MEDGIYFGLDQDTYHRLERFSASGASNMMVSPATYWADSWMNPDRFEDPEEGETDADATAAQIAGKAYHMARLEPELFRQVYYRGLKIKEYPKALTNHAQIKEELAKLGEKAGTDKVLDAAKRLRAAGYPGPIKHLLEEEIREGKEDWQIELPWKLFDQIVADMAALEGNDQIRPLLHEGESEVSVLWTDDKGVKWKARFDRLQINKVIDLKTFDNSRGKELEAAIYDSVQYNRYYLQAYIYWTAAELIRAGKLSIKKLQREEQRELIKAIKTSPDPFEYWWVFQEKGGVPNVLARRLVMTEQPHPSHLAGAPDEASRKVLAKKLQSPSMIWKKAELEVRAMRDLLLRCLEIWGTGRWGSLHPVDDITDEGFNPRWLEEV